MHGDFAVFDMHSSISEPELMSLLYTLNPTLLITSQTYWISIKRANDGPQDVFKNEVISSDIQCRLDEHEWVCLIPHLMLQFNSTSSIFLSVSVVLTTFCMIVYVMPKANMCLLPWKFCLWRHKIRTPLRQTWCFYCVILLSYHNPDQSNASKINSIKKRFGISYIH